MIRLCRPVIEPHELQAVENVLKSGMLVQGKNVAEFEKTVADYIGIEHAVAVSSGTAALHLSLLALGVKSGDLVLVSSYSWPATANVIELCGAKPVFVDILPDTFNMDTSNLDKTLEQLSESELENIKAIVPVDAFGQMAEMNKIKELSEKYDIPIVEDAACALGAVHNDKKAGAWSDFTCFSFHPRKAVTTGEGGIIATGNESWANTLKTLRNHGLDATASKPDFIVPGFNYRMTDFQGALGIHQMAKMDALIEKRIAAAKNYNELLKDTVVTAPVVSANNIHVYQSYIVLLPNGVADQRDTIIQKMRDDDVETSIGTWHMPLTTFYKNQYGFMPGDFPVTDDVFKRSLALPLDAQITKDEQKQVVNTLLKYIK